MAHRQTNTITRNSAITDSHQYVPQVIHAVGKSNHQRHCPGLIGHVAKKLNRQLVNVMDGILSFDSEIVDVIAGLQGQIHREQHNSSLLVGTKLHRRGYRERLTMSGYGFKGNRARRIFMTDEDRRGDLS